MPAFCAAADWGTTNFRLWLLEGTGQVLAERESDEGLRACIPDRFEKVLERHLADLGAARDLPVVIAGMAGARSGWCEAPYLETPAVLTELARQAVRVGIQGRDVRILPGVCQDHAEKPDVIRGEETQVLGALQQGQDGGVFCLPGTHSKWVEVKDGRLTAFTTFMTGELFDVLSRHSILSESAGAAEADLQGSPTFLTALREVAEGEAGLMERLFSVRAASLLHGQSTEEGRARLSGLLIGAEIAAALKRYRTDGPVKLIAAGSLAETYRAALSAAEVEVLLLNGKTLAREGLHAAARRIWGDRTT